MPSAKNPQHDILALESRRLGRKVFYHAIFPEDYDVSSSPTPVLYLLHGLFGRFDNWLTNTKIIEYARQHSFAIVCPDGGDGWYADSPLIENHFYESYFLHELSPAVESRFNLGKSRRKRAVAGLSMGGYGAFKFAFRQPDKFCFAASMSGAFHAAEIVGDDLWTELQSSILAVFGDDHALRTENDLLQIARNFPAERIAALPHLYFDCGAQDEFLPVNIKLSAIFAERGIVHEFKIISGGHDWNYWNTQLENILQKAEFYLT